MDKPSHEQLVDALQAAGSAHHDFESNALNGVHDQQWAGWYAGYVLGRLGDFATPTVLAGWLTDAPAADDWPSSAADYVNERLGTT